MKPRPLAARAAPNPAWDWAIAAAAVLTAARLLVLRVSPLQLYPDEAQYWAWAQHLAPGYFTKPPLIAWIIRLTTLGGDGETFVRLSSPLLHAAAALFLFRAAARLYDDRTALFAFLVYMLMPAVQLGAFVATTDTPMMACLAGALWAYSALQSATGRGRATAAAWLGFALGLGFLAKYAALYAVAGVVLHLLLSRSARRAWTPAAALVAVSLFAALALPNLVWNTANGFPAFLRLEHDAAWGRGGPAMAGVFLLGQLAVFGPLAFAVLALGAAWLLARRRLEAADGLLLCWTAPPLAIMLGQSLVGASDANWAVAAYAPASVALAAWMLRWRRPRMLVGLLGLHGLVAVLALSIAAAPQIAERLGLSATLRGLRDGRALASLVIGQAQQAQLAGPLTAVAVDDRETFYTLAYYGRGYFGVQGPPLKAWAPHGRPRTQAEFDAPLTVAAGERVLAVSLDGRSTAAMRARFLSVGPAAVGDVWQGGGRRIELEMFVGEGYRPASQASGLRAPPGTPPPSWP